MAQRSRYVLPEIVEPETSRCFLVEIPNDRAYISAFMGAMYGLSRPYVWQNDDDHTALAVGARMQTTFDTIVEVDCGMLALEFRVCEGSCGLEYRLGPNSPWTCVDLSGCITSLANDAILQAIADGIIQVPGDQQSPTDPPVPGACKNYHVVLLANSAWHCPNPVSENDTITILNAVGGWYDGELAPFGMWSCPDGKEYIAGACGDDVPPDPSDPVQTANHMALVGGLMDGTYFAALNGYTVPAGKTNLDFLLFANDGTRSDNQGSIEFDVSVCSGGWNHYFDFTAGNQSWIAYNDGRNWAVHTASLGFMHGDSNTNATYIGSPAFTGHVSKIRVTLDRVNPYSSTPGAYAFMNFQGGTRILISGAQTVYEWAPNWSFSNQRLAIWIGRTDGVFQTPLFYIRSVYCEGTGADPFI